MEEEIILSLTDEELYKLFISQFDRIQTLKNEKGKLMFKRTDKEDVKHGFNGMQFDMSLYFRYKDNPKVGLFRMRPKKGLIRIPNFNGYVAIKDFHDELERRRNIMLKALFEFYANMDEAFKPK